MARVRLFANLREIAGNGRVEIEGTTVGEVTDALVATYGRDFGRGLEHAKVWVNGDEAEPSSPVGEADEVAFIPPVSGGAEAFRSVPGLDVAIVAIAVVALLASNTFGSSVAWFSAVLVGVVGLWAVDLTAQATARGLPLDPAPVLASTLIGALAAAGLGAEGMGLAAALAIVISLSWAVFRPDARDLTRIGSLLFVSVIAATGTASLILARLSTDGDDKVAAFLVMAVGSALVTWGIGLMRRPIIDPFTAGSIATVVVSVLIAVAASLDLVTWFLVGIVTAVSLIAGRGIGAAFRTGEVFLSERAQGTLAVLDGPILAATVFFPFLRLVG